MKNLADDVAAYLENKKHRLRDLYKWEFDPRIPKKEFGISISKENPAAMTLSLRRGLRKFLKGNPDGKSKERVARYFIRDWGGIRRFTKSKEVVAQFEDMAGTTEIPKSPFRFEGVSSWSKWATLVCPRWACIYDARVAYSLNAINFLEGATHKIFPSPEGRNSRLRSLDAGTLVLAQRLSAEISDLRGDLNTDDHLVSREDVYREYLELVRAVSGKLWGDAKHTQTVEMLLFAISAGDVYDDLIAHLRQTKRAWVNSKPTIAGGADKKSRSQDLTYRKAVSSI